MKRTELKRKTPIRSRSDHMADALIYARRPKPPRGKPSIEELIAKSSIGVALADVKARGIEAHLASFKPRKRPRPSKYNQRERAPESWWIWIKSSPCMVAVFKGIADYLFLDSGTILLDTPCGGAIEADHMGSRGIGQKALDNTCAPMCTNHHGERGDFTGAFKNFKQADMRAFLATAIQYTQNRARCAGVEIPSV